MAAACNFSIPSGRCTLETCCLAQSSFLYRPSYGGNLFFAVYFTTAIIPHLWLTWSYRTWGYGIAMVMGLWIEVVGYTGRIMLHQNPFNGNGFLIYLICVTIAPVFMTASIYLCLSRIIMLYGENLSYLKPRTISILFMTSDFTSLVLQAAGGGSAYLATDHNSRQIGINIMIAGLLLQVVSLASFLSYMAYFAVRCRQTSIARTPDANNRCHSTAFKVFLFSLVLATFAILTRSIFRVIELWQGFTGNLWNSEVDFLVLDGAMIALAVLLLTVFHPGVAFGDQWHTANWTFKSKSTNIAKRVRG